LELSLIVAFRRFHAAKTEVIRAGRARCLSCRYLSICHGGCPVRTYSALGTMMAKDPYCEVYKAVFACAEAQAGEILRARAAPIVSLREPYEAVVSSTE